MLIDPRKKSLYFALQVYRPGSEMEKIYNLEFKTEKITLNEDYFQQNK